jgi:hypothetical protein
MHASNARAAEPVSYRAEPVSASGRRPGEPELVRELGGSSVSIARRRADAHAGISRTNHGTDKRRQGSEGLLPALVSVGMSADIMPPTDAGRTP